jgi:hypothetical protein
MTKEQYDKLMSLVTAVHDVRRHAAEKYLPFELAAAIERADDRQGEAYGVISDLYNEQPSQRT